MSESRNCLQNTNSQRLVRVMGSGPAAGQQQGQQGATCGGGPTLSQGGCKAWVLGAGGGEAEAMAKRLGSPRPLGLAGTAPLSWGPSSAIQTQEALTMRALRRESQAVPAWGHQPEESSSGWGARGATAEREPSKRKRLASLHSPWTGLPASWDPGLAHPSSSAPGNMAETLQ